MTWKSKVAELRYLKNDFPAKLAWTLHLFSKGQSDITGIEKDVFKGFDIKTRSVEYEVMRASSWKPDKESFPYRTYDIFERKLPCNYEKVDGLEQVYVMIRSDWAKAQLISADVDWKEKPDGRYCADPAESWTVDLEPTAVGCIRAAEDWGLQCLEFNLNDVA